MRVTLRVEGLAEARRQLRDLGRSVDRRATLRALTAGGEVIAERARSLVPVESGQLRDSIAVGTELRHFGPVARGGVIGQAGIPVSGSGINVYVGPSSPDGFYGHMVEFGTIFAAARPFMRPALDRSLSEAEAAIARVLIEEIERAARR